MSDQSRVFVRCWKILAFTAVLLGLFAATGCGGASSQISPPPPPPPASAVAQLKMGDAPADRVVSFEVTVGPITMTPTSGSAVTALSGTRRIELSHLSGTNEPLALLNVSQGSYSSMSITVSKPEVTFINNLGATVKLQPSFSQPVTVNFNPALTLGASASVLNIDLNAANSLTFDALGNVTGVNIGAASFTISASAVAAEAQQEAENGELEDTTGKVTNVSGSSFTMTVGDAGASLTFATDANTEFNDGATLGTILNMIVKVEGITRSDGSLYAKEVEGIENQTGAEAEGLITQVTGNPATQLSVIVQDGMGSGMDPTQLGSTLTVDVSGAHYRVDRGSVDTSGIGNLPSSPNFPFDASTIHAGQRVEADTSSMSAGAPLTADKVKLQQQSLTGAVSGLAGPTSAGPVTFTLTLPADSAFAMLSGQTSVTVFWQPGTDLHNLASVKNGDVVRVRGLVFFTGSNFNMIAHRIGQ